MPATFDRDLRSILERARCYKVRDGKRHEIWYSPLSDHNFSVPRRIKIRHMANEILKQAGLPKTL